MCPIDENEFLLINNDKRRVESTVTWYVIYAFIIGARQDESTQCLKIRKITVTVAVTLT
jgi:hypothetical protein